MGLKEYPRLNLKRAFWRWYLNSTGSGENLFNQTVNQLVLYTNINKTTSFYRLLGTVRSKQKKVHPRVKRMTTMIYLYTRIFFDRSKREFFEKFKIVGASKKVSIAEKLVDCAKKRKISAFKLWLQEAKKRRDEINSKRGLYVECARKLLDTEEKRKKNALIHWRNKVNELNRIKEIQKRFLTRLLMSKAGRVAEAWRLIKNLPEKIDAEARKRAARFEKGLSTFAEKTLRKSFNEFRRDLEEGQASKKRGVVQLINVTMNGQKKMFNRWNLMSERKKLINECKQVSSVFATLNFAIKSVADIAFLDSKDQALKEKALTQLFKNMQGNMGDCFKKWRDLNNIEKLRESMSNKEKASVLKVLENLLHNGKNAQVREAINKFRMNRKITEIQRNFLKRLLMSKAGMVVIAFRKIQTLPERKDAEAYQRANKFEKGLSQFVDRTLKRSFYAFKTDLDEGQAFKKRAVIQLINTTMGGQKKMYNRWLSITDRTRLMNECKQVASVFSTLNFAIKSVADIAFLDSKDQALKEKALTQLFKNMQGNMGDCFKKWRDLNNIEKLRESMSNKEKASVLKVLENLLHNGKNAQVREAINKFRMNRKITEIQRNFLKRLLMSKAGMVVIAFRKIQTLPERKDAEAYQRANKFEKGLSQFVDRTLKRSFYAFKTDLDEGQAFKKRAVIQLINTTMGGQKKMYNRWLSITDRTRLMNECKQVASVFSTLNFAIKSVADIAFLDSKDQALKEKALTQLFKNMQGNMGDCFKKWRDLNNIEKLRESMSNKEKASVLKVLENLLHNGKNAQVREAINKFRMNRKITEIQRNFLKRLLMSKAGMVVIAFRKIQTLPERKDAEAYQRANKFEKGLSQFVDRTLKRSFYAFKTDLDEGQAFKKRAVIQLINTTMGGQKKMYNRWLSITDRTRLMNECKQVASVFSTLNFAIKSVADIAFLDSKDQALKEKALTQLFKNMQGNMGDCFKKWRDLNNIEKLRESMSNKEKASVLKVLENLLHNGKNAQVREAINKFRMNRKITEIQRNFLKRLLMSKAGMVVIAFRKIQTLPERKDAEAYQRANKFEKGLSQFVDRTLKRSFYAFKTDLDEGQAFKKRAVIQLINTTMGGQKKMYNRWLSITDRTRLMNECKQVASVFSTLNFAIKSVADIAFLDSKDQALKEKALTQLFKNMQGNMGDCFKKWRDLNNIEKLRESMSNKEKASVLKVLENLLHNGKNAQVREAINKFRMNRKITEIQRNFLKRLLMSKAGMVVIAFRKIQTLPERKDAEAYQRANKFEKGLSQFVDRTLKRSFYAFKTDLDEGQAFKKRAVIQLINTTMGGQKKMYNRWLSITDRTRLMNECKQVASVFSTLNFAIKSVADIAFLDSKDQALKEKALTQLFKNMQGNMGDCFKKWRDLNNIEKLRESMSNKEKASVLKVLENLLHNGKNAQVREAINKFRMNRKITEIQRNFLKRLLMSKAGMVVIAFRKIQTLPERKDAEAYQRANKFEKGLSQFVDRTLKRSFYAFKTDLDEGQAFKKRAVIQLINTTMGGQKKMYNRWLSITDRTRLMNECKQVASVFSTLNFAIKSVADIAFLDSKDQALKEKALTQLFKNMQGNMGDCFKKWRDLNNIEKLRESMSNKEKASVLKVLENLLHNGKNAQVREAINKFRMNRKITEIQRNFLKRLLMSKAGMVVIAFRKIQTLPERKDAEAYQRANKFEKGLSQFVDRTLKRSFYAFKTDLDEGQAFKKRAVIQLINTTMGGQKKMYNRWLSITDRTRLMNECKQVASVFSTLNFAIKSVADIAFLDSKDQALKEKALTQLFKNMQGNMGDCFKKWRDLNNIEKLRESMSNKEKASVLKVLENLLHNGKNAQVREAINKFRMNRKITEIQRNFLKRLLMSKAGMVVIAFRKIQTLPERKDAEAYQRANKFEKGLSQFVDRTLKRSFYAFKTDLDEGQAFKKRAVIQLINTTMGGQKKMYNRWLSITDRTRLMNECKQVASVFSTLNFAIKSVADIAFLDSKDQALKEKALTQLFKNMQGNMGDCFKKWRDLNNIEKLRESMSNKEKASVLKVLENLLHNGKNAQVREAINKFRMNRKITEIQRNFLKRLLMSKAGMVVIAFRKIQTLPERKDAEAYQRANKFEKGLSQFVDRTLKRSFYAFKTDLDEGQAFKKRAVIQLINTTMGGQKKMYNRWLSITDRTRLMNECKQVASVFSTLNFAIKSVADIAFLDSKDQALKEKALTQLFKNMQGNMGDCFKKWRDLNNIEKLRESMSNKEKASVLKVLENLLHNGKNAQVREAINKFRMNRKITEIQRNFLKRLLMSKAGMVVIAFRKIQTLPERKDAEAYQRANKFEKGLSQFVDRTLKRSFYAFKTDLDEGQAFKKRAVIQLINTTMGGQKKMYNRWLSITDRTRLMNECKQVASVFSTLNFAIKSVADIAFLDSKDQALKEKALTQLFKNMQGNMGDCFKKWRDLNNIEKLRESMSNKEKASVLKVLENLLHNGKNAQVREAINKFRMNRKITEIQRNFLKRLLMSKAGMVVIAFRKIQTLPERKDAEAYQRANKFEKGLSQFVDRTLKRSFYAFKTDLDEGQAFKKRAVIQLINTTMGGQKKMYNRWLSITDRTRLMNECKQVASVFSTLNFAIKSVADIAFLDSKDQALKEKALTQLFKNMHGNMGDCFKKWRDLNNIEKLRESMSNKEKASVLKVLENLLHNGKNAQVREAINKFRMNRKITEIQRNFLKRLLMSKAGMVVIAFRKIQTLPERKDAEAYQRANKFEKGLSQFVDRTLKRSFYAFKTDLDEGQAFKKRAVIQLINTTMGGQKKMYNRWLSITDRTRLMNECKQVASVFSTLNFAIKSVADIAFLDSKDQALKEKALTQLFKNMQGNMGDCFKKWRDLNNIEKLRESMSNKEKASVLKVLENLLHNGKNAQVREAINKFRMNRKITEIQRNFLKRLLMSKAGMVVIAFRKIQTLPERKDAEAYQRANKFEKGLSQFVDRTLKRSFYAFKTDLDEGQAFKKRAVIQLINTTMGGQKKMYNRWLSITDRTRLMNECKQVASVFSTLNFAIKSVADIAFLDSKDQALK